MRSKNYFKAVLAFSLALAIVIPLWFAAPVMHCYSQGYGGAGGGAGGGGEYPGLTSLEGKITSGGALFQDVTASSSCVLCTLTISKGTKVRTKWGTPLYWIIMVDMEDPPPAPQGFEIVGCVSDGTPDGVTFEPSANLTFTYDLALLPEGISWESLFIGMWDAATGKWVLLDATVDPDKNTITAQITHFTPFAMLVETTPATFTVTDLTLSPVEADIGETVTITVIVTNSGAFAGSYEVTLEVDEAVVATEEVTLAGGTSQKLTFTTIKDVAGTYTVNVNGLTGEFEVRAPTPTPPTPAPTPTPPLPAPGVINWYLIGGIIAGAIIIGVVVWLTLRRRGV